MSLSATLFGRDSLIFKATNVLGLGIPGWLDKQFGAGDNTLEGQRIGEISQQTAKEGEPRVIVWGRVRPIGGHIMHCQKPVIKWKETEVEGGGGKGGGKKKKQVQRTQHVYRSYAIGVCEGPITKFSRIWRNNKLVYDARGNSWGNKNNGVFLKHHRLYLGNWNQGRDPTLQRIWGMNIPAYRGTAYIVAIDEDLTEYGGALPQWLFEVERAEGVVYTSKPYAVESSEFLALAPGGSSVRVGGTQHGYGQEYLGITPSVVSVELKGPLRMQPEYLGITPSVVSVKFSVTNAAEHEYLGVTPTVIGAELI